MKKIFSLLLALMCTVGMWANEGDVAYEFVIAKSSGNSNYASTYDVTIGSYQWNVPGNHYANGQLRLGGQNFEADRVITGKSAFTDPIKQVTINHGACSSDKLTVKSITLVVASDAAFSSVIEQITLTGAEGAAIITKSTETTSISFSPSTLATWPKGAYYKLVFSMKCTDTSNNRNVTINSIQFIEGEGGTVVTKYAINKSATTNGSIAVRIGGADVTEAAENSVVSLIATPDAGYRFVSWSVTGATPASTTAATTTFTMGTSAVNVGATFEQIPSHNITISSSIENGNVTATIDGESVTSALEGEVISISAIAADGYKFDSWSVTGATVATNAPATTTITMGTSDVEISANFVVSHDIEFALNNAGFGTSYTGSVTKAVIEAAGGYVSQTKSDVVVKYALGEGSNFFINDAQARMYSGNTLTITAPTGAKLTRIAFVRPTKDAGTWPTDKITTDPIGYDKTNLVWEGSANEVVFSFSDTHRLAGLIVNIASEDITISAAGYATYYNADNAVKLPTGVTGYVMSYNTAKDNVNLVKWYDADNSVVPAGEPIVLGAEAGNYTLIYTTTAEEPLGEDNLLKGAATDMTAEQMVAANPGMSKFYALSLNKDGEASSVGFYWIKADGAAFDISAGKAYLALPADELAPARFIFGQQGVPTEVVNVNDNNQSTKVLRDGRLYIVRDGNLFDLNGRLVK